MSDPVSNVSGANTLYPAQDGSISTLPASQQLGQKDFIKLLVAQMSAQDPMNPQQDTQFIGQMAQFASLQSTQSLATDIQTMRANQLLGQTVEIKLDASNNLKGIVSAVDSSGSAPKIIVAGQKYDLGDVIRVDQTTTANTPA